jgi:hypothetical protein
VTHALSDTDPEIERMLVEAARRLSPGERLMRVFELNRAAETMALAGLRQRHGPGLSPREEQLRLAALRLGRETMVEVFDWDPEVEGY